MNKKFLLALSFLTLHSSYGMFVVGWASKAQEEFEKILPQATSIATCRDALTASALKSGTPSELADQIKELLQLNKQISIHDLSEKTLNFHQANKALSDLQYQNLQNAFNRSLRDAEYKLKEKESSCDCDCLGAIYRLFDNPNLIGS
jgi:hypothetical protein